MPSGKEFTVVRYELDGQIPVIKSGLYELLVCPDCIKDGEYGVITDNFCSGCGKCFGHVKDAEVKDKKVVERTNISWRKKCYLGGMSLSDITRLMVKDGKSFTEIAEALSLISESDISIANVSVHAKRMNLKRKVILQVDEMITNLHAIRVQFRGEKIPQQVLANACGISQSMISQMENGVCISAEVLIDLALVLGWGDNPADLIKPWNGADLTEKMLPVGECSRLTAEWEQYYARNRSKSNG
jgi:hypothetical protein